MRKVRRSRPSLQLVSPPGRVQRESGCQDGAGDPRSPRRRRCRSEQRGAPQLCEDSEKVHLLRGRACAHVLRLMGNVVRREGAGPRSRRMIGQGGVAEATREGRADGGGPRKGAGPLTTGARGGGVSAGWRGARALQPPPDVRGAPLPRAIVWLLLCLGRRPFLPEDPRLPFVCGRPALGVGPGSACQTGPPLVVASPCGPSGPGHGCPRSAPHSPRLCFAWLPPFTSTVHTA